MLHFSILKFEYFIKSYCRELKVLVSFSEENKKNIYRHSICTRCDYQNVC